MTVPVLGRRWVLGVATLTLLAACGDDTSKESDADSRDVEASPFTVDLDVAGYEVVSAGAGIYRQVWGDDSDSTNEPFTALRRRGVEGMDGVVLVSVTGFEGQEGGLSQSARGNETEQSFTVDGHEAIYSPAGSGVLGPTWADLVVVVGDDLAVRVTTPEASREELLEWFRRVEPQGPARAPTISLSNDLQEIGTVDADAAIASRAYAAPRSDLVPGPESGFAIGWIGEDPRESLALLAVPGDAADLDALAVGQVLLDWRDPVIERGQRDGVQHLVVEEEDAEHERYTRSIWVARPGGDLLLARAVGKDRPSRDALFALLDQVRPADERSWEALVIEATGGPGLHPDEGHQEVARGTVGDIEWLLQTGPLEQPDDRFYSEVGADGMGIDPCLKLSNRKRACGGGGGGSSFDWFHSTPSGSNGLPPYVILSTSLQGATSVRVTTRAGEVAAPLHQVPGKQLWGAVVFVDDPGLASCDGEPPGTVPGSPKTSTMRVDALDAGGKVVGCLGLGGDTGIH